MPHTHVPWEPVAHAWQVGMGIPFKVVGQEPGQKDGQEAGRATSLHALPHPQDCQTMVGKLGAGKWWWG